MIRKIISFLVVVISITLSGLIIYKNYYTFKAELNGESKMIVSYKSRYDDPLFTIDRNGNKIDYHETDYNVISDVDTMNIGEYTVKYSINYRGMHFDLNRVVEVVDNTPPTINVNVDKVEKDYCDSKLPSVKVNAIDDLDGDVSDKVTKEEKDNKLILTVTDSNNNTATKEIEIAYKDKPANKVVINGKANMTIRIGSEFKDEGAYYSDGCGKKINDDITIEGTVDTNKTGTYKITYTSKTDSSIKATRTVNVNNIPPAQSAPQTGNSVIYLTFDDGPGAYTTQILDTLDKYNIKATFFVTNQFPRYQNLIGEEARRGHTIGVHTLTHQWSIYTSLDTYWNDFNAMNDIIEKQTGKRATILRFPGGTSNQVSKTAMSTIASSVLEKGYEYYDWNVCVEDAGACVKQTDKQTCVYNYFKGQLKAGRDNIVLMHDIKSYTAQSLEKMINYAISNGYTFKTINSETAVVHFKPYK